jgi:S1-C subfamily serine protease
MNRSPIKRTRLLAAVAALALGLALTGTSRANPEVYNKALRSTAWILTPSGEKTGIGSGAVIDEGRKLLVTNAHVVGDKTEVLVFFPALESGTVITDPAHYLKNQARLGLVGRVVFKDMGRDLALVELPRLPADAKALALASASPSPGQMIHAIGNSGTNDGGLWRYSDGKVRLVYTKTFTHGPGGAAESTLKARVVESSLNINEGDSGGPNLNDRGELVAVTQSFDMRRRNLTNSVDVNEVRAVLDAFRTAPRKEGGPAERKDAPRKPGTGNGDKFQRRGARGRIGDMAGTWKVTRVEGDEQVGGGRIRFYPNGTYAWWVGQGAGTPDTVDTGRYSYADGLLTFAGTRLKDSAKLSWANGDRCSLTSGGIDFILDRQAE